MPWLFILRATVAISRLPVLSPLPKSVPSTLLAPAISPNSVAAVPVPLSLWVCRLIIADSLFFRLLQNHSIWSAWTLGVVHSTVAGKFKIIGLVKVGSHTSMTPSQTSRANSISVSEKLSGEYSRSTFVAGTVLTSSLMS